MSAALNACCSASWSSPRCWYRSASFRWLCAGAPARAACARCRDQLPPGTASGRARRDNSATRPAIRPRTAACRRCAAAARLDRWTAPRLLIAGIGSGQRVVERHPSGIACQGTAATAEVAHAAMALKVTERLIAVGEPFAQVAVTRHSGDQLAKGINPAWRQPLPAAGT